MMGLNEQLIWPDKRRIYCEDCGILLADFMINIKRHEDDGDIILERHYYCDRCLEKKEVGK